MKFITKFLLITGLLGLVNLASHASTLCTNCGKIKSLTAYFEPLKPSNSEDAGHGLAKVDDVIDLIGDFADQQKQHEDELIELVNLSVAALPFDPEKALSFRLSQALSSKGELKLVFQRQIARIKDQCTRQFYTSQIAVMTCTQELHGGITVSKSGKADVPCPPSFDFAACVKKSHE